jgi:hypothetical protein
VNASAVAPGGAPQEYEGFVDRHGEALGQNALRLLDDDARFEGHVELRLEDIYIAAERTLIDRGRFAAVLETRSAFQDAMAPQFKAAVEQETGRRVIAFTSQSHANPDLAVEFFLLGGAVDEPFSDGPGETPDE